jgi:energy-coupling factor transporter ATP-binding protein EcfA2
VDIIFNRWHEFVAVRTKIGLNNVPVENLSAGQRGTLLLKIYLASATDKQIFIIDQPEDNLDNKFISDEMVPMLRKIKQSRQVILSTHNANIVVGCDADQVIVARLDENEPADRVYATGGIENEKINHYIQSILEGGSEALALRHRRYI